MIKFADRWLQCYLFVAKKIFLKQKSHYSDEFICDVTGQRGSNIIEDRGCARLILILHRSFWLAGRRCNTTRHDTEYSLSFVLNHTDLLCVPSVILKFSLWKFYLALWQFYFPSWKFFFSFMAILFSFMEVLFFFMEVLFS